MSWSVINPFKRKKRRGLPVVVVPREKVLAIFRPVDQWGVFHSPTLSVDVCIERQALRALDRAYIDRTQELSSARRRRI